MRHPLHLISFAAVACSLLLAGCMSQAELAAAAEAQAEADRQVCRDLGFEEGSEAFANCRLKLLEVRAIEDQTYALERAAIAYPYPWGFYGHPYWYDEDYYDD